MRIYLSALSVHRAEQRANIVFTHTHGFAMQIIWYYCTYSTYQRGSSVTGTASTLLSFLHWPSIYLHDARTRIYLSVVSKSILLLLLLLRVAYYFQRSFLVASIKEHGYPTLASCTMGFTMVSRVILFG